MWIVPSFIAACIINNTSLPEWKPNWFEFCNHLNMWLVNRTHFIPKLKWSEIEHHCAEEKCSNERLEAPIFSPFPASCTQLATENCRRSRAICSDSSGTAERGGGETMCHLYNRSRLPTVSKEQLQQHTPKNTQTTSPPTHTHSPTHLRTGLKHKLNWHFFYNLTISMNLSQFSKNKTTESYQISTFCFVSKLQSFSAFSNWCILKCSWVEHKNTESTATLNCPTFG